MAYKKRSVAVRFWEKVDKSGDCWLWTAAKYPTGYGSFVKAKGQSPEGAHRVSYRLTYGKIPIGSMVLHKCDVRECVRPSHLYLGNHVDNARDMHSRGRWRYARRDQSGERNPNSIISDADVLSMIDDINSGEGPVSVARKYGISYKTLWAIRHRKAAGN